MPIGGHRPYPCGFCGCPIEPDDDDAYLPKHFKDAPLIWVHLDCAYDWHTLTSLRTHNRIWRYLPKRGPRP